MKNKALIMLFLVVLVLHIMVHNSLAYENVTHNEINITAPGEYLLNYTETNITHQYPFNCLENLTKLNISCTKCDVTRSMNQGEIYAREDAYCKLNFECPTCECEDVENVSRAWEYRIYTEDDGDICVVTLIDNESRCYSKGDNFDFTDEFKIDCPRLEDYEDELQKRIREWQPVNITEDQWYWLCLEPFGKYGETLEELATTMTDFQRKLIHDIEACSVTRDSLSRQVGELGEQIKGYEECRTKRAESESKIERLQNELNVCQDENKEHESGSWLITFFFWGLFGINILIAMGLFMWKGFHWITGVDSEVKHKVYTHRIKGK